VQDPDARLPIGDRVSGEVLSLPFSPGLSDENQDRVIAALLKGLTGGV
jgi:dTDP-4-amino-4,6-dideoxygalactose transaminase